MNERVVLKRLERSSDIVGKYLQRLEKSRQILTEKLIGDLDDYGRVFNKKAPLGERTLDYAYARKNIENILSKSGYYDVADDLTTDGYSDLLSDANEFYDDLYDKSITLSPLNKNTLDIIKRNDFAKFSMSGDALKQEVINVITSAKTKAEAVESLKASTTKFASYASTWIDTAAHSFHRETGLLLSEDAGIKLFEYVGPLDKKTRPFCAHYYGKVMTRDQWDELDNGQKLRPVSRFGGGYNCRHKLIGRSKQFWRGEEMPTGDDDVDMIRKYTGEWHKKVNPYLRNDEEALAAGKDKFIDDDIDRMSAQLKKLPKYDGTVYRGEAYDEKSDFEDAMKGNQEAYNNRIRRDEFLSAGKTPESIDGFKYGRYKIEYEIQSKNGRAISGKSYYGAEDEILFDRGSRFKVTSILEKRPNWYYIVYKEI